MLECRVVLYVIAIMGKSLKSIIKDEGLNITENPYGTDKGDRKSYIDLFYEYHFSPYRHKKVSLLEIGVRHGASLRLWASYFHDAELIMGIDDGSDISISQELPVQREWTEGGNICLKTGDAYGIAMSDKAGRKFDIIIDDGPHSLWSQKRFIKLYAPLLREGGIMIIEDLLMGYITCTALLCNTPLKYKACIYDFRWHKPGRDNMIYALKHAQDKRFEFLRRILACAKCLVMLPGEIVYSQFIL